MDAFFGVTTKCSGKCITCPAWTIKREPQHMSVSTFQRAWEKCNESPKIDRILINWIGDIFHHPARNELWAIMEQDKRKELIVTTTGDRIDYVSPAIDTLVISFNGYNRETYERVTKIPFDAAVANIRAHYRDFGALKNVELHHIVFEGVDRPNEYVELWRDFPGRVRYTTKYDTKKFTKDRTLPGWKAKKIPCIYFDALTIAPSGRVLMCVQDMAFTTTWGNIIDDSIDDLFNRSERQEWKARHAAGDFGGFCADCNCNVPVEGKVWFAK